MYRVAFIVALFLLLLTGCASQAERMESRYGGDCRELGFTQGTTEYSNCLINMQNNAVSKFGVLINMQGLNK